MQRCPTCHRIVHDAAVSTCPDDDAQLLPLLQRWSTDAADVLGRLIGTHWMVDGVLGAGGAGVVLRAHHLFLDRVVAIKVLKPESLTDERARERFLEEAKRAAVIDHPGVVKVLDFGLSPPGMPYIVLELLEGRSLKAALRRDGAFPPAEAVEIATQLCDALVAVHEAGYVHRDIKPSNVWLGPGRAPAVTLLDFGLVTPRHAAAAFAGTPRYMSPEQITGEPVDARTDVYALGCVLFELLTGRPVFDAVDREALLAQHRLSPAPSPASLAPRTPRHVDELVARCLAKDPSARPASARVVLDLLQADATTEPQVGDGDDTLPPVFEVPASRSVSDESTELEGPPPGGHRWWGAGLAVVLLVGLGAWWTAAGPAESAPSGRASAPGLRPLPPSVLSVEPRRAPVPAAGVSLEPTAPTTTDPSGTGTTPSTAPGDDAPPGETGSPEAAAGSDRDLGAQVPLANPEAAGGSAPPASDLRAPARRSPRRRAAPTRKKQPVEAVLPVW